MWMELDDFDFDLAVKEIKISRYTSHSRERAMLVDFDGREVDSGRIIIVIVCVADRVWRLWRIVLVWRAAGGCIPYLEY